MKKIRIFTDGGSRGNPGQAACATVIKDENNNLYTSEIYLAIISTYF